MVERMITVVIPTYNRFDCIKYFFETCFKTYTGKLFTFEIHDSSEDNYVKEYIDANIGDSSILKYFKYDPSINGDVKTMRAILSVDTEYVYLMADGVLMDFNQWETWLLRNDYCKYSLIAIECESGKKSGETTICTTAQDTFNKFWSALTMYGGSITQKRIFKDSAIIIKKYIDIESPFAYICTIYEWLAINVGKCIFISVKNWVSKRPGGLANPHKKGSGWYVRGEVLKVWFHDLNRSLLLLPSLYDRSFLYRRTKKVYKSFSYLFHLRMSRNLTLSKILLYKNDIKVLAGKEVLFRMYISLLFPAWFLKLAYQIRHKKKVK